jgi:hypothetical protein
MSLLLQLLQMVNDVIQVCGSRRIRTQEGKDSGG